MADHDTERLLSGFADHLLKGRSGAGAGRVVRDDAGPALLLPHGAAGRVGRGPESQHCQTGGSGCDSTLLNPHPI
jgi:hypothetical protein